MTVRPSPIREAIDALPYVRDPGPEMVVDHPLKAAALAELDALEAVADALGRAPALILTVEEYERWYIEDCYPALARLVAVQDGQTPRGGASASDGTDAGSQPANGCAERQSRPGVPRGVCPCKSHGDPDGDCGEDCA